MENHRKYNFLNSWYAAELSLVGIGFSLCLSDIKLKDLKPLKDMLRFSNWLVLACILLLLIIVINFFIRQMLIEKYDQAIENIQEKDILPSLFISILCLTIGIWDFRTIEFVYYLLGLLSCIVLFNTCLDKFERSEAFENKIDNILQIIAWPLLIITITVKAIHAFGISLLI